MTWPADEEVRFVWQEAFADSAAYLDNSEEDSPTSIGGWTPDSMDPPTMELSLKRDDLDLRFFDPTTSVIVPAATRETGSRIIRPSILPLEPSIEDRLIMMGASSEDRGSFTIYEMESVNLPSQVESVDMSFGEELLLLGYEWNDPCDNGGSCELLTYWQVLKAVEEPRSLFLHLVDSEGAIISQDDGMGAVSDYWQEGDLIVQHFSLDLTSSAEAAAINLGLYQPLSGERKLLPDGSQFHSLNFPGSSNR